MSTPSIHTLSSTFGVVPLAVATCAEVQALSHRALRVYLVLLARHNAKRDGWAWSLTALANDTGIVRKKVPEAIQQIAQAGLVEIEAGGGRASTHYRLLVPPSLRVVPTAGTSTPVQSPRRGLQQSPKRGLLNDEEGTPAVPTAGTPVVPTAGTTRQRSYTDDTEEPPYPHSEQNRAEPKNPLAPCKQGEPIRSSFSEGSRFALPERYNKVKRPPGPWQHKQAPAPAPEVAVARTETASASDLIRQVARDLGVRPREARKHLERQEASAVERERTERHGAPSVLTVDDEIMREMRELYGWAEA
jgi:biotin operon repressor